MNVLFIIILILIGLVLLHMIYLEEHPIDYKKMGEEITREQMEAVGCSEEEIEEIINY